MILTLTDIYGKKHNFVGNKITYYSVELEDDDIYVCINGKIIHVMTNQYNNLTRVLYKLRLQLGDLRITFMTRKTKRSLIRKEHTDLIRERNLYIGYNNINYKARAKEIEIEIGSTIEE